jgi:peptide-methionine (R)-S-oxide reductase
MLTRRFLLSAAAAAAATPALSGSAFGAGRFPLSLTDAEWRKRLTPDQYAILRQAGTERPGTSPLLNEHRTGVFSCAGCNLDAFSSKTKFESGTGWPSFWDVLPKAVVRDTDPSLGMVRTEILCARCGGHMGHVFDDGPKPTGLRYCMNGLALKFRPTKA